MTQILQLLGRSTQDAFSKLGRGSFFLIHTLRGVTDVACRPTLLIKQIYSVGVLSFLIITISAWLWRNYSLAAASLTGGWTLPKTGVSPRPCKHELFLGKAQLQPMQAPTLRRGGV